MEAIKPTKTGFASIQKPHSKQTEYRIEGMSGIRIRVGSKGALAFSVRVRVNDSVRRVPMQVKDLSKAGVMAALVEAKAHAKVMANVGPVNLQSVGEAVIRDSDISAGTERNYKNALRHLSEALGTKLTDDAGELLMAHRKITEAYGAVSANNCLKFYRRCLNYANAAHGVGLAWPTDALRTLKIWAKEKPRQGRVEFRDLRRVWHAASHQMPEPWGRLTLFYLITGLRNTEALKGSPEGDDFVVVDTKNGTDHKLPMTGLMRHYYQDGFDVKNGRHVTDYLEEFTGLHFTPHDLRRTFAAVANHAGVSTHTIDCLLNHTRSTEDITGRYIGKNRDTMEIALHEVANAYGRLVAQGELEMDEEAERMAKLHRLRTTANGMVNVLVDDDGQPYVERTAEVAELPRERAADSA